MRITLPAVHISGQDNVKGDPLSRFRIENPCRLERSTEWSLDRRVINLLFDIWGQPTVDLFATQLNNKVEMFFSCLPDPLALQGNSLPSSLAGQFPAGRLVQGSTVHVSPSATRPTPVPCSSQGDQVREEAQVIAIQPWWRRRGWFPLILQLLVDLPVMLSERDGLLLTPDGTEFPDLMELRLAAWRPSGDLSTAEVFREKLLPPYVQLIDSRCELCTTTSGGPFVAGVLDGRRIPFTRLSERCCVICSICNVGT